MRTYRIPAFALFLSLIGCGPSMQATSSQACLDQSSFEVEPAANWLPPSSATPCERTVLVPLGGSMAFETGWLPRPKAGSKPVLYYFEALATVDQSGNFGTIDLIPVMRSRYTGGFTELLGMPLTDIGSSKRLGASSTVSTADGDVGVRILVTSDRSTGGTTPWKVTINRVVAVELSTP